MAEFEPLLQLGGIGAVLVWFMTRFEKRLSELTIAMLLNTRATILGQMLSDMSPGQWREARSILKNTEEELTKKGVKVDDHQQSGYARTSQEAYRH